MTTLLPKAAVLDVQDLHVTLHRRGYAVPVVRGLSFDVHQGETLALVGESGAGKSLTVQAVLGLLPPGSEVRGGIRFGGQELAGAPQTTYRPLRGRRMAFVPQDALSVLSPVHTIGDQLVMAARSVQGLGRKAARDLAVDALDRVGIADARRRSRAYPHEFSGGMRQQAVIAMAMINEPDLVVADEPTTALDPAVQAQVLDLLRRLRDESGTGVVLVTHDLGVVAGHADRVLVMENGRQVESGHVTQILDRPKAPSTARLVASLPTGDATRGLRPTTEHPPLLDVRELTVRYAGRRRRAEPVLAVDGVSFEVQAGETLALVGESGCGKSSTAAAVLRLRRPDGGRVLFQGQDLAILDEPAMRRLRPAMQPVFQDPYGSLSPRQRVRDILAEPLRVQGRWDPLTGPARVGELLELVRLDRTLGDRLPHELSGGQCQRVGIARALASEPRLLVLDEPVTALDPSVRAGVVDLLTDLQDELGLGYLFICHDLGLVRRMAHRVAVMRKGRIVEVA